MFVSSQGLGLNLITPPNLVSTNLVSTVQCALDSMPKFKAICNCTTISTGTYCVTRYVGMSTKGINMNRRWWVRP